jgi:hypothetical protein
MKKIIAATALAALFAAAPALAADAPNVDPGVNTGKEARTPSDNSVGVKGDRGNKNGPSAKSGSSSNGSSTGEMGKSTSGSDAAAGVKGGEGGKNGPAATSPNDNSMSK